MGKQKRISKGYNYRSVIKSIELLGKNCQECGSSRYVETHHLDLNPRNNEPSNWKRLCSKCHKKKHPSYGLQNIIRKEVPHIDLIGYKKYGIEPIEIEELNIKINKLTDRERNIFILRNKHEMTLAAIGKLYGLDRERIRQIDKKACGKLASWLRLSGISGPSMTYVENIRPLKYA